MTDDLANLQPELPHRNGSGNWHWPEPSPLDMAPVAKALGEAVAQMIQHPAPPKGAPARKAAKSAKRRANLAAQVVKELDRRISLARVIRPPRTDEVGTPTLPGLD